MDETPPPGLTPPEVARALAERKARAVAPRVPGRVVLAADTVVYLGATMYEKPVDRADAVRILSLLSGRTHRVATGVAVAMDDRLESEVDVAEVTFRPLSGAEIAAAVEEGLDKAGAYALQGAAGGWVSALAGDPDTVVGLPVRLVRILLSRLALRSEAGPRR